MNFVICLCGAQPGYPHTTDCPRPLYHATAEQEQSWRDERARYRDAALEEAEETAWAAEEEALSWAAEETAATAAAAREAWLRHREVRRRPFETRP